MGSDASPDPEADGEPRVLSGDGTDVVVQKVRTRNGERLRLANRETGSSIAIDALGLESLSWQDHDDLARRLGLPTADRPPEPDGAERLFAYGIVNEFTDVTVTGWRHEHGDVLGIDAPKVEFGIRLGPAVLGAIADREMELFSSFLETPYGPEEN